MARTVDPEMRQKAYVAVRNHLALTSSDVARFDVGFPGGHEHFVARVDYSVMRGGGYQIFEGNIGFGVDTVSAVLGRGRVTPRFPLVAQRPVKTNQELAEEHRREMLQIEYDPLLDDERVG
jgi:hypothetical protein